MADFRKNEYKSERLKKFEAELTDLKQWLDLGLVPKKEIEKHKEEIKNIETKMEDEKARIRLIKETGDNEDLITRKKNIGKVAYAEPQTLPDMEVRQEQEATTEIEIPEVEKESKGYKEEATVIEELEEDPFSDKNRWKRGVLEDPDADLW